jgi:hypothetical protein
LELFYAASVLERLKHAKDAEAAQNKHPPCVWQIAVKPPGSSRGNCKERSKPNFFISDESVFEHSNRRDKRGDENPSGANEGSQNEPGAHSGKAKHGSDNRLGRSFHDGSLSKD